jgi:hypothetical protein
VWFVEIEPPHGVGDEALSFDTCDRWGGFRFAMSVPQGGLLAMKELPCAHTPPLHVHLACFSPVLVAHLFSSHVRTTAFMVRA